MSMSRVEMIICPKCGKEASFVIWQSINTKLDPEMKEKVRNDEAFMFTCPECGNRNLVDYPTLYHQMEDNIMIYYVPEGDIDEVQQAYEEIKGMDVFEEVDFKHRIVLERNDFKEKVKILDEGLDDKVIEIMKLFLRAHFEDSDPDTVIEQMLFDSTAQGERFFAVRLEGDTWGEVRFEKDLYDALAEKFKEKIENDDTLLIDFNWALETIKE